MLVHTTHLPKTFGEVIRNERLRLKLSQEELAFESGISLTYMGEIERGEKMVSLETIVRVASGLRITAAELLGRAGL